eukprot:scaffold40279_cov39-Phaeocystis_antarctica.AAC.1
MRNEGRWARAPAGTVTVSCPPKGEVTRSRWPLTTPAGTVTSTSRVAAAAAGGGAVAAGGGGDLSGE